MTEAFPDLSSGIDDMIAEGDRVAVRGRVQGTNTGPFQGRPPNGNPVSMGFITICRVRDGKVTETWGYNDMAGFLRSSALSRDRRVQERLWKTAESLTGIRTLP